MRRFEQSRPKTHPGRSRVSLPLVLAALLTLALRLWFVLSMRGHPFSSIGPEFVDSYFYHRWAIEITSGDFWGTDVFFLRPLYPYLLAAVYAVFGQHVLAVQLLQALLAGASCCLLFDTTRRMFGSGPAAFAGIGFALTGILVFYTGALLYVELTIFLALFSLWCILIAGRRIGLWALAGASLGLLVICRPEMLVLLPFLCVWLRPRGSSDLSARKPQAEARAPNATRANVATLVVAALVVIAVVPVRNYLVARDPVLFTAHSGVNFYYGNNPDADGAWQPTSELERGPGFSHERLKRLSRTVEGREVRWSQASAYWLGKGLRFIASNPLSWLRLLGRKLLLFLSNYEAPNGYYPETARVASLPLRLAFVNFGVALAFGFLGMVWAWPRRTQVLPAYLFVGVHLASTLLFYVLSRLRAPVIPFLLMFAGYGLSELARALRQRRRVWAGTGIAAVVLIYLASVLIPVQRKSYSAQAWTQVGNIYLRQRQVGPAVEALRRALGLMPSAYNARYSLVLALAGSGKTAEAEAEFSQLARSAGASSEARALVRLASARLAIARRDFARAAVFYRSSLAEDPDDAETSYMLGLVYISMDSLVQARRELERAVALDPGQEAARAALQAVESRIGR